MNKSPIVSFITVNYNRKDDVVELLTNISKQTYKRNEVIIVDNASNDGSASAIEAMYPRIHLIKQLNNSGIAGYNRGMQCAQGEIFILLDNDVLIGKDLSEKVIKYFKNHPEVDVINFRVMSLRPTKHVQKISHKRKKIGDSGYETTTINIGACAVRRQVYENVGGFREDYFIYCNEFEYGARALMAGFILRYDNRITVLHKQSQSSFKSPGIEYLLIAKNWLYFLCEFIPLSRLYEFLPFLGKNAIKSSIRNQKTSQLIYYVIGVIIGLITIWPVLARRKPVTGKALQKIIGGLLGKYGFVYTWY